MRRDVSTPLVLWICAAICAHFIFGEGGEQAAQLHDDHSQIYGLILKAHDATVLNEQTFEVSLADQTPPVEEPKPPEEQPKPDDKAQPDVPAKPDPTKPAVVDPPKVEPPKPQTPPPPKPPPPPEPKKPDPVVPPPKPPEPKKDEPPAPKPPLPQEPDHRIAVIQQAKPDQKDNPTATHIADQANHVDQETVSHLTNHEKDEANPTPGGSHRNPSENPGDSDRTKIAATDTHAGDPTRAPGERGTQITLLPPQATPSPLPPPTTLNPPVPPPAAPAHAGDNHPVATAPTPTPQETPQAPGSDGQAAPAVEDAPGGSWTFNPARPVTGTGSGESQASGPGGAAHPPPAVNPAAPIFGLGVRSAPGEINFNLNQQAVAQIVGQDQLRRDRANAGARIRSEHLGSWQASNFERWRSAIENYLPSVRDGNQTALNTAQVPFATYINLIHNRIHPIFAESSGSSPAFLETLQSLPASSPLNDRKLITALEIVLTKDGQLKRMGVTRTSGVTAFDIAALDSVNRAAPFGPAPAAIVSPDGNVYLHWEFHRDEVFACSTMNARPYILKGSPTTPEPPPVNPPGAPPAPQEHLPQPTGNPGDGRMGFVPPAEQPAAPPQLLSRAHPSG